MGRQRGERIQAEERIGTFGLEMCRKIRRGRTTLQCLELNFMVFCIIPYNQCFKR